MKKLLITVLLLLPSLLAIPAFAAEGNGEASPTYLTTREEFVKAITDKVPVIYVDDIDFSSEKPITLNYDVSIVGKEEGSTLTGGYFTVRGSNVESKAVSFSFENVAFDGAFVPPDGWTSGKSSYFTEAFGGDRASKRCLSVEGFLHLTLKNCKISRYCSGQGPALYCNEEWDEKVGTISSVSLENCQIIDNICETGTVWFNSRYSTLAVSDSLFSGNIARSAAGISLTTADARIENSTFSDNIYSRFGPTSRKGFIVEGGSANYIQPLRYMGGALYVGATAADESDTVCLHCTFNGNTAEYGGAVGVEMANLYMEDCLLRNNRATIGGGAFYAMLAETNGLYLTNTEITGNSAQKTEPFILCRRKNTATPFGWLEFSFCRISDNTVTSTGGSSCLFYKGLSTTVDTENTGIVRLYGCTVDCALTKALNDDENQTTLEADFCTFGEVTAEPIPYATYQTWAKRRFADTHASLSAGLIPESVCAHRMIEVESKVATCTEDGNIACRQCVDCNLYFDESGDEIADIRIPACHRTEFHEKKNSSIFANGTEAYFVCSDCQMLFNESGEEIDAPVTIRFNFLRLILLLVFVLVASVLLFFLFFGKRRKLSPQAVGQPTEDGVNESYPMETLTPEERRMIELVLEGKKYREIAELIHFSESTVKHTMPKIYEKLHVADRDELMSRYRDRH